MNQQVRDNLMELRDMSGAETLTEVIRRALSVYYYLWKAKRSGADLYMRRPNDDPEKIVLL